MSSPTPTSLTICIDSDEEAADRSSNLELVCSVLLPTLESSSSVPLKPVRNSHGLGRHPVSFCVSSSAGVLRLQAHGDLSGIVIPIAEDDIEGICITKSQAKITLRKAIEAGTFYEEPVSTLALQPKHGVTADVMHESLRAWLPSVQLNTDIATIQAAKRQPDWRSVVLKWDGIELSARDAELLGEERCLNDSVIDFCLKLVMQVVAPPELRQRMLVTSTFFYQKLTSNGVERGEEGWKNVRKWHAHIPGGVLSQDYIVVPVNEHNLHWFLVVICFPAHAFPDSEPPKLSGHQPRIVSLDSGQEVTPKGETVDFLRGYLYSEWFDRRGFCSQVSREHIEERFATMEALRPDVPTQQNGTDCGIFIILYLITLCRSETSRFGLGLAPHTYWFGSVEVSECRKQLAHILALLKKAALRTGVTCVGRLLQQDDIFSAVQQALVRPPRPLASQEDGNGNGNKTRAAASSPSAAASPSAASPSAAAAASSASVAASREQASSENWSPQPKEPTSSTSSHRRPPKRQAATDALQRVRKQQKTSR